MDTTVERLSSCGKMRGVISDPQSPPVVLGPTTASKVAFVGPLGVGKTTAVRSLSDVKVIGTDVSRALLAVSEESAFDKRTTTVGIDYGEWTAPDGRRIALVGTPGQLRFGIARASVMAATPRLVLWLFGDSRERLPEAEEWISSVGDESAWSRLVVAVTRRSGPDAPDLAEFSEIAHRHYSGIPVIDGDPRSREDVQRVVLTALGDPSALHHASSGV